MDTRLEQQAKLLAAEPYTLEIMLDETTHGQQVYLLAHPELPGCMAQGQTIGQAATELEEVRGEYILSLLEDGVPVPRPATKTTETVAGFSDKNIMVHTVSQDRGFLDNLSGVVQPKSRQHLGTVSVIR